MSFGPVKFLLVDDVADNLLVLDGLLRREGLELLKARSGVEALELLLVHDVALAILDVQMPGMDGFELAELMRGTERTRHVPIIFLTAGGPDEQRRFRGYEAGAVDFLFKPIEPHILQSKAGVFFELRRQQQEVMRQRDELRAVAEQNTRLLEESQRTAEALRRLNDALEERVRMRTEELELRTEELEARTGELEARNRELQSFAYAASHDFQEPLRKIQTFANLLMLEAGDLLDEERRGYVERVQSSAARMSQLLQDMLTFSRVSSQPRPFGPVPLHGVIRQVLVDLDLNIAEVGARVDVDADVELWADAGQLRQLLNLLLLNALKYRKPATPLRVRITATVEPPAAAEEAARWGEEKVYCRLVVEDNGIGFNPKYAERIFRPFERLHSKSTYPGTGMGLTICRRIVERHGGTITAFGEPGVGARFTVSLPVHQDQDAVQEARSPDRT